MGTIGDELGKNAVLSRFLALAEAIEAHREDWTGYVTSNPQGRQVLPFVVALAADLRSQNERLTGTVERMKGRVAHIVDIIRTQKSFEDGAMVRKNVNLRSALAESVKVLSESLDSRGIEVEIDTGNAPAELWVQESRLHQMLVNLAKNAVEADRRTEGAGRAGAAAHRVRMPPRRRLPDHRRDRQRHRHRHRGRTQPPHIRRRLHYQGRRKRTGAALGGELRDRCGGRISALSDGIGTGTTVRVMLRHNRARTASDQRA